ncbi:hypothetical protein [Flavobacterium sp. ZB4P13]|uniref:hypothetical protein n=1 Tax=Flavobacterium sp. ZB4P13 TaxID=3401728 RepID=UPI003AAF94CB
MKEKNTTTIIKITFFSFLFASILVYGLNHLGKISFLYDYTSPPRADGKISFQEYIPADTKIRIFYFDTYFKNKVEIDGGKWTASDVNYKSDFDNYSNKSEFYLKGTIADKKYILWIGLAVIFLFLILVYFSEIKRYIVDAKNNSNKIHLGYSGVILVLIVLFITTYLDKQNYIDYNNDLTEQIEELNNRISDLEDENEQLKDKVTSNEYDLKKSEIDREYYETLHNITSNNDDLYTLKRSVLYETIKGTEFEQYIVSGNTSYVQVEIKGAGNVIKFLNAISNEYYLMYLRK